MIEPASTRLALLYLALVCATFALSVLVARNETLPGDTDILAWAQDQPFPGEAFSEVIRTITMTEVVLGTGGAIAVALWLLGRRWEAALLAAGLVVLPILQWGVKELVDRPRPAPPLAELRAGFSSPSFPAGHVMSPTYLYAVLLCLAVCSDLPRSARWLLGGWSVFVLAFAAPPNVWLGVHWPSDILGGWAWGLALALPVVWALRRL